MQRADLSPIWAQLCNLHLTACLWGPCPRARFEVVLPHRQPQALLQWHTAQQLWRRRSGLVAFVKLAKAGDEGTYTGFKQDLLAACGSLVQSPERFHQTGGRRCLLGVVALWRRLPNPLP